ncbi:hypothetical protein [Nakamurella lactea]|uniref:hypothetical protein n=1 Tax=Nakamurella lactea TaxID=459515 RepID=UPI000425695D|nr:hypothetical protein [Nakamurella lactea]
MNEFTAIPVAGIPDLQRAALAEARRMMREAKGDRAAATTLMYDELERRGLITQVERETLGKMHQVGLRSASSKSSASNDEHDRADATAGYLEVSRMYDRMLADGGTGPVALALAAGAVGSYEVVENPDGVPGVVYAKSNRNYQAILGGAGAIIGSGFGPLGGAIGGAVGGVIGTIVDDCKD